MNSILCPKCKRPMNVGNSPNRYECTQTSDDEGLCEAYETIYKLNIALNGMVNDWERVHGRIPDDHEARVILNEVNIP